MKIAIRVDASSQIGTGHFMRCLSLADGLNQRGAQIRFVCRHLPEHLEDMLVAREYAFMPLNSCSNDAIAGDLAHARWLGASQAQDAADTIHALSDQFWDWLVVDHYALDACWETELRKAAKNILVIDDIADRQHDCDILLDQNFYANMDTRYTDKVPLHCQLLLGPRYALLRDEFRQLREHIRPRTGAVKRVLVFFGGVDADNFVSRVIEALANNDIKGSKVDVVIGVQHPQREAIESACAEHQFDCHVQTNRMAELMAAADLAIGAGGSATWERCCLGLPAFVICTAANQVKQVADAASEGWLYAPELKGELVEEIQCHLRTLLANDCLRKAISSNGMQIVDGCGVLRIMGNMGCGGIEIRVANREDSGQIFKWRNHATVRAVSRNREVIHWGTHQKWFEEVLASPDRLLLIGQRKGAPVGVVRFDIRGNEAEVSIYLVPGTVEAGLGRNLLQSAEHWFKVNRPEISKIVAHVLGDNERSHRLFAGLDYRVESTLYSKVLQ
ncbi:MAG: UDP-2,4-diacetamido-2,4,6-trideoxy-beta-L-altropyranose hydrolase [Nitrosomonadales bacterium]|nr:UDP-2,4-diacetamido-2,4,6-trideoxy-beta-L-altropyranose hydrolase [Nitrosomonadales bacterium]